MDKTFTLRQGENIPIDLEFHGDHEHHSIDLDEAKIFYDPDSLTLKIAFKGSHDAEDIYWRLLSILPRLREDNG